MARARPVAGSRARGRGWWIAGTLLVAIAVMVAAGLVFQATMPPSVPALPPYATVDASIGGTNGSVIALGSGFLGINLRANASLSDSAIATLNSTGVRFARWPGGGLGDRYDPFANGGQGAIYADSGKSTPAGTSLAEFVAWCRAISCGSVVTLPAEIDNASEARAVVNVTENTLGFHPTYWEIGNEPALWTHFGIGWSHWNASQNRTPTMAQYTALVASYIAAIRSVDPAARIIGLGGVGRGAALSWLSAIVSAEGPNLSAIALHVYPAGFGFPATSLGDWFATLTSTSSLPARVASAATTVHAACPTCSLELLVDEFQTGTQLTAATALSGGYLATYVAAELVQALPLPIVSLDYFDFQGETPGAWLSPTGIPSAGLFLYQGIFDYLGPYAVPLNISALAPGLLAAAGGPNPRALTSLMLVNTNTSAGFRVNLSSRFPSAAAGSAWVFNGSAALPTEVPIGAVGAQSWRVPPASVVIFRDLGASSSPLARGTPAASGGVPTLGPTLVASGEPSVYAAPRPYAAPGRMPGRCAR